MRLLVFLSPALMLAARACARSVAGNVGFVTEPFGVQARRRPSPSSSSSLKEIRTETRTVEETPAVSNPEEKPDSLFSGWGAGKSEKRVEMQRIPPEVFEQLEEGRKKQMVQNVIWLLLLVRVTYINLVDQDESVQYICELRGSQYASSCTHIGDWIQKVFLLDTSLLPFGH
uniref:Uncharacterized protein n=1 Tax=Chromera velia CCMP2878 TaxID=1169474 RepID=A0A0G4G5C2_9ALVE|eukprot:Cvel_20321.t1-p1 / transcript=Cvel_20321.t1 / gene=Cvel_20321 / organism=Chromera_velia_CCMP2878 / gene_product=hypothetical protein / transcript_product=hypothetical protein / location=Cvel_scaffold1815:6909-10411(-) / protein_length=171 / sequence_SO=supercontig / SO=protein_coding / is_pseudo=false